MFDVKFSFLPVNRFPLHLTLRDQETCDTLHYGGHSICKEYLNSPGRSYCQCNNGWYDQHCNETNKCLQLKCMWKCIGCHPVDPAPICVCPLGRIDNDCHVKFDPCITIHCYNGGTCVPLDERSVKKFICVCVAGLYGLSCESRAAEVSTSFSSDLIENKRRSIPCKDESVKWAKRVIFVLVAIVCASWWHEPFIRQVTDDPRITAHTWCIVNSHGLG
ncbi:unnamed protein product [Didymodactylos carnosus]|uniref:EGF-like domain-containing protein n=1 Tax=Didymodactylos carnosus TaxID=1234261 RepID=A0A814IUT0_9BILA|nr:unnamed protein product [Didymodactylos carnosus]CAF1029253.1 unnamed protein product [Didymodactylos carnosus]CAF3555417.1 unnamed protein product [Didymodactylos carnosus]CAF3800189.1 unnamed protein product [Didymodactylos carnosus]